MKVDVDGAFAIVGLLIGALITTGIMAIVIGVGGERAAMNFCVQAGYKTYIDFSFGKTDWHITCKKPLDGTLEHTFNPKEYAQSRTEIVASPAITIPEGDRYYDGIRVKCDDGTRFTCESSTKNECWKNCKGHDASLEKEALEPPTRVLNWTLTENSDVFGELHIYQGRNQPILNVTCKGRYCEVYCIQDCDAQTGKEYDSNKIWAWWLK